MHDGSNWTRRAMLAATLAGAGALAMPLGARTPGHTPLGVQLWTVKDALAADAAATLAAIAAAGFTHVELAGWPPGSSARFGDALAASGLACTSAHLPILHADDDELTRALAAAALVGITHVYAPIPGFSGVDALAPEKRAAASLTRTLTADDWRWNAAQLNRIAAEAAGHGIAIGYHNHNIEFAPFADGTTPLALLLAETDPAQVHFQLDVGHALLAGADPFALLAAHPGRFASAHLKEWARPFTTRTILDLPPSGDFGDATIDWRRWLAAARTSGVTSFFVERDNLAAADQLPAVAQAGAWFAA